MDQQTLSAHEAERLAEQACRSAGANPATARSLATATVSAALHGRPAVGFPHLLQYLAGFSAGRLNGEADPTLTHPLPAILHSDADGGTAQLGFDLAMPTLVASTRELGVTLFTQHNGFTTGELGYYVRRLAIEGLIALAVSNSPAVVAGSSGGKAVFGTNPMAFAAPLSDPHAPLVIDQASSATALVNLAEAADAGRRIPEGWALDAAGRPTTDATAALRGTLLAFGGTKGANVALMVECLAAGLSGASWSLDMADPQEGQRSVDAGMTIIAIQPRLIDEHFVSRLSRQLDRLSAQGTYVPGRRPVHDNVRGEGSVVIDTAVLEAIRRYLPGPE
ncbi:Ldh family oxidoreductase [Larsenimonas salina]|uniref:Ldh family oxidoreductase n=1 Tax=Larsenimonas salina TaxID=1295565 RepID=UPI0020735768|nr:Ldh family oxidoreductase [Larsenimonas salina]MCM5705783.1 Ldh family oxidoreductase [Larsenimonas salina]